jgi:ATP-dependent Lon protease
VHVPEGATPKDGPSAGAAMVTAIMSALTGIEVRKDIAMTGEVNLRGKVTEIGGLKEKLLAALRAGIKKALIPQDNEKDLPEIPANVKKAIEIVPVRTIDEVLAHALIEMPRGKAAESKEKIGTIPSDAADSKGDDVIRH